MKNKKEMFVPSGLEELRHNDDVPVGIPTKKSLLKKIFLRVMQDLITVGAICWIVIFVVWSIRRLIGIF